MFWQRIKTVLLRAVLSLTLILSSLTVAGAAGEQIGFGVIVGEPTGLSAKYLINRESAIDLAVAWNLSGDNDFILHSDFLWHLYGLFKIGRVDMPLYFGVGGRIELRESRRDKVGIRLPVGVSYRFEDPQFLELFVETAPILDLTPDTKMDLNIGTGARIFFF